MKFPRKPTFSLHFEISHSFFFLYIRYKSERILTFFSFRTCNVSKGIHSKGYQENNNPQPKIGGVQKMKISSSTIICWEASFILLQSTSAFKNLKVKMKTEGKNEND